MSKAIIGSVLLAPMRERSPRVRGVTARKRRVRDNMAFVSTPRGVRVVRRSQG